MHLTLPQIGANILGLIYTTFLVLSYCALLFIPPSNAFAATIVTITKADSLLIEYRNALIELSLEKSHKEYGDFEFQYIHIQPSGERTSRLIKLDKYKNLIMGHGVTTELIADKGLKFLDYPIYQGVLGYRVCFTSKSAEKTASKANNLKSIQDLKFLVGLHWSDTAILEHNLIDIEVGAKHSALFEMIARQRADLFCRGINEIKTEAEGMGKKLKLTVNKSFYLQYDNPIVFTSSINSTILERINIGIKNAQSDGSLLRLWKEYFGESIRYVDLEKRNLIRLETPYNHLFSDRMRQELTESKHYFKVSEEDTNDSKLRVPTTPFKTE
jgi:hypothetical protein